LGLFQQGCGKHNKLQREKRRESRGQRRKKEMKNLWRVAKKKGNLLIKRGPPGRKDRHEKRKESRHTRRTEKNKGVVIGGQRKGKATV